MTQNPVVAFGLNATAAAMGAKCGQTSLRSRMDLAIATLRLVPRDEAACTAVADFLVLSERDPVTAGHGLQDFVSAWVNRIPRQDAQEVTDGAPLFDWQKRADLQ